MNKKYIETEDHTIVLDENSDAEYRENCSNMEEILLKENELEVLKNEKENILLTQKSNKFDQKNLIVGDTLMVLIMVFLAVIFFKCSIFISMLPTFGALFIGAISIKEIYDIKVSSKINKEMLNLLEQSIDKFESELTSLKDKKSESKKIKEYNILKNLDEKGKLLDLKKKLELYREYMMKKEKYDRLNEKGELKYKLQENHTNHEIEIIENFSNTYMSHKQKAKKYGEYNGL